MSPKIQEFKALTNLIEYRNDVELEWEATGYEKLMLYHNQYQSDGIDVTKHRNYIFSKILESIEFELQAISQSKQIVSKKVFVKVVEPPVINYFRTNFPLTWDGILCVHELEPLILEWEVFNADNISLEPLNWNNLQSKDKITIPSPKQDTIYKLNASNLLYNGEKSVEKSVFVSVKSMTWFDRAMVPHFNALDSINYVELKDIFPKEKSKELIKQINDLSEIEIPIPNVYDFLKFLKDKIYKFV